MLVATEPFLVAHGAVLRTDELMTLLAVPPDDTRPRRRFTRTRPTRKTAR